MSTLRPGEIYWFDDAPDEPHRVIVVSAEKFNRGGYVTVVLLTSKYYQQRRTFRNCVPFQSGEFESKKDCVAQCENIFTISTSELSVGPGPIDILDGEKLRDVIRAIGYVIGADCEPAAEIDE